MGCQMKNFPRLALALLALCPAASALRGEQPVSALPPFIITGRVIDYRGAGIVSAEVRVRKEGRLIARSNVGSFDADTSANYAVSVPMSNVGSESAATTNDMLTLEIEAGADTYSDTNLVVRAAKPGRTLRLDVRAASCTNGSGVSDAYLADISDYVGALGISGFFGADGKYLPDADFDGDGVSNYVEYLAGTDPFDPEDAGLRFLSFKPADGNPDLMEATFLPGPNRAYSAERAEVPKSGGSPAFELRPHQQTPASGAAAKNYLLTGSEDPEVRAIYLYKEGASSLYRLRLE